MNEDPIVIIEWFDSSISSAEESREETIKHRAVQVTTVGYMIHKDDDGVVISMEHFPNNDSFRGTHYIPMVNVVDIKHLMSYHE